MSGTVHVWNGYQWVGVGGITPLPPAGLYPDPGAVGLSNPGALTTYTGDPHLYGTQTLEDYDIPFGLTIRNDADITLRNCRITSGATYNVNVWERGSIYMEDCQVISQTGTAASIRADTDGTYHLNRVDLSGTPADFFKGQTDCIIEYCWMHDPNSGAGSHADAIQVEGQADNFIIRNNRIDLQTGATPGGNACIFINVDFGSGTSPGPITVEGNYFNGGNYQVFCTINSETGAQIDNIGFFSNTFGPDNAYGYVTGNMIKYWAGNVDHLGNPLAL